MSKKSGSIYFENLDGFRAIAAFTVVFFHISLYFKFPESAFYNAVKYFFSFGSNGGSLGVTFFFVLSGFLITYLMFKEQSDAGSLNIPRFYLRRVLRIWPLYYLTIFVGFVIYPFIIRSAGHTYIENGSALLYSLFLVNFDHIYGTLPSTGILGVQWSVAIEEQFYLLWPLVFFFIGKNKYFPGIVFVLLAISDILFLKTKYWSVGYFHFATNFRFLAFGGILAYFCFFKKEYVVRFFSKISKYFHLFIYVICVLLMFFVQSITSSFPLYRYVNHVLPVLFFGFVIVEQNYSPNSFFKIGKWHFLTWLGKISYGLYLTHMIAIYFVMEALPETLPLFVKAALSVILTILISYLSYNFYESYFLSLKDKYWSSGIRKKEN